MGDIGHNVPVRTDSPPDGSGECDEEYYCWKEDESPAWKEFLREKRDKIIQNVWNQLKVKYMRVRDPWDVLVHLTLKNGQVPNKKRKLRRYPRFPRSGFCSVDRECWPANPDLSSDSDCENGQVPNKKRKL